MTVQFTQGKDSRYDFTIDVAHGELAEHAAAKLLTIESVEVKAKRYDDSQYYVEYEQNPRNSGEWVPSGIAITEASHWVFIYCENEVALTVTVGVLKEAGRVAAHNKANWKDIAGDNPTKGIMVSLNQILDCAYNRRPFKKRGGRYG